MQALKKYCKDCDCCHFNIQIYRNGHLPKLLLTKVSIYPKSFDQNCHLPKWLFTQKIYTQISFTEKVITEVDHTHLTAHGSEDNSQTELELLQGKWA